MIESSSASGHECDRRRAKGARKKHSKFGVNLIFVVRHALDYCSCALDAGEHLEIDRIHIAHHVCDSEPEGYGYLDARVGGHHEVVGR
jgi:hypothetical protein